MIPRDTTARNNCLQTNNDNGLPVFRGYGDGCHEAGGRSKRIHHQHQAIIPSYKFNCCGNITEWGVDLNPDGTSAMFDFVLQVWRPSPSVNVTGCYSLVDDFSSTGITIRSNQVSENVARITPSPQQQPQFQPGDVLGFYVESHGQGGGPGGDADNGVVLLTTGNYTSESVWFASVDFPDQTSKAGSCPYPIGTDGVLDSLTRAAPVISVSTTAYSCRRSFSSSSGLISGVVVAIIIVCVSTLAIIIVTAVMIVKKRRKKVSSSGISLSNQVYGELNYLTDSIIDSDVTHE